MKVLAIAPHCDDVELGCLGYLLKLAEQGHDTYVIAYSYSEDSLPEGMKLAMLNEFNSAMDAAGINHSNFNYKVRTFHEHRQEILETMVEERKRNNPDMVLIPCSADIHQDHQVIHAEGVRAFSRYCNVLGYELPWNCREFNPTHFVELTKAQLDRKIELIYHYKSQVHLHRDYFDKTLLRGFARVRGLQVKRTYAEAYETITYYD